MKVVLSYLILFYMSASHAAPVDCPKVSCWSDFTKGLIYVGQYRSYESRSKWPLSSFAQYYPERRIVHFGFYEEVDGQQLFAVTADMALTDGHKAIQGVDSKNQNHAMSCELVEIAPVGYYGCPPIP